MAESERCPCCKKEGRFDEKSGEYKYVCGAKRLADSYNDDLWVVGCPEAFNNAIAYAEALDKIRGEMFPDISSWEVVSKDELIQAIECIEEIIDTVRPDTQGER